MSIQKIKILKTAKFAIHGDLHPKNTNTNKIAILALHGYGQLAQFFIRNFQGLDTEKYCVVAPEGLHRFYLEGTSGRVGASWMTKEERLDDIADNMVYLDTMFEEIIEPLGCKQLVVLGFSQGAATAARWIEYSDQKIDAFIQWAGVFPPDMNMKLASNKFNTLKHFYVVGDKDTYFTNSENSALQEEWLHNHGLAPELISFDGAHQLDLACLSGILDKIQ